ncbi:hypothetical protein [Elizabethkingia anophelis]|uniref:hypothetical protein n=1 Tax=Elizabethkingia anophelis TaxID=1117645 RepID=UPI0029253661|nr:MAG: hypothetical protein PQ275_23760 [Elizabethkingia anophelis]
MSNRKEGIYSIKIEKLNLDQLNPRLYGDSEKESQEEIMQRIYDKENIDELATSLAMNGYFEEEPIIVIPKSEEDFDKITNTNASDFDYIVVEGNRRITSVKLLLNKNTIVDEDFPEIKSSDIKSKLINIPSIIYRKREDVDIYLSIRHIAGNRKWDAYAKAKYIYEKVNKLSEDRGVDKIEAIALLSQQIGDKKDIIKKNYTYYKVFLSIENDVINYSSKEIKDRFSLLEVALASGNTTVSQYIGLPPFRNVNLDSESIIQPKYIDNLKDVTEWIFGKDERGTNSLISDSRNINKYLKPILGNEEATTHLKEYDDIEGAFALSGGEEKLVIGNVKKSNAQLSRILSKISKYKDNSDFINSYDELKETIKNFEKLLN